MNNIKLSFLTKAIVLMLAAIVMIACGSSRKPHQMQYLINRNYLTDLGLGRTTSILDMKGHMHVDAINIGTPSNPKVEGFMTFDANGNLMSVSKEKGENLILKLVEFKYDKDGVLTWIVPNQEYFSALNYDSLRIEYKGIKPFRSIALKKRKEIWTENITFDDAKGVYLFSRLLDNNQNELFNLYRFKGDRMLAEYHRNRTSDNYIDSTRYYYRNDKLYKKTGVFNYSTVHITNYDELERPTKNTTMFYKKDSIAWVDKYYYLLDDKIPHSIITSSPLGWREETNYYWDK